MTTDSTAPRPPAYRTPLVFALLCVAAGLTRFIPHPPGFTAIGALALYAGACGIDRRWAYLGIFSTLLISDSLIALHELIPLTYLCFGFSVFLGEAFRSRRSEVRPVAGMTFLGAVVFFLVTNFGCWILFHGAMLNKLVDCYIDAIPFFAYQLAGDFFYVTLFFGGLAFAEGKLTFLAPADESERT